MFNSEENTTQNSSYGYSEVQPESTNVAVIKVIGVGGALFAAQISLGVQGLGGVDAHQA